MFIDPSVTAPLPGDFAVVTVGGAGGEAISAGERLGSILDGDPFRSLAGRVRNPHLPAGILQPWQYEHAFVYTGGNVIVQAEPGGAQRVTIRDFSSGWASILWSTGVIPLTVADRDSICAAANGYAFRDVGYSDLDYLALFAHGLHVPAPGLREYIRTTQHMICSQLVDAAYQAAAVKLFNDGRWNGYVKPSDLAALIESSPVAVSLRPKLRPRPA